MPRPVFSVDQHDVGPAVIVIVNKSATGTHGLGQVFLAEGGVVMDKVDAGRGGDIAEVDGLGASCGTYPEQQ
jgi:hypothetical protein